MTFPLQQVKNRCVAVRVQGDDPHKLRAYQHQFFDSYDGVTSLSCSGLVVGQHTILTHGGCLVSFLVGGIEASQPYLRPTTCVDVCLEGEKVWRRCKLRRLVSLPVVSACITQLQRGAEAFWKEPAQATDVFAVLDLVDALSPDRLGLPRASWWLQAPLLHQGQELWTVSSPYGLLSRDVFQNSVTRGVVCNDVNQVLFLTDARCLPGSQGGAVFDAQGHFVGLLTVPLEHRHSTVALNAFVGARVLGSLLQPHPQGKAAQFSLVSSVPDEPALSHDHGDHQQHPSLAPWQDRIVLIKAGVSWATGLLVSGQGFILTNAHLFGAGSTEATASVWIRWHKLWYPARLVFLSEGCWDVAVVQVRDADFTCRAGGFERSLPQEGQDVFVIGHALFAAPANLRATVTKGVLSKVVRLNGDCVLLQTSAAVHSGNSGGVVISANSGKFLGLVTSNIKFHGEPPRGPRVIPRLNLAIPAEQLEPLFQFCLTEKSSVLTQFEFRSSHGKTARAIRRIWAITADGDADIDTDVDVNVDPEPESEPPYPKAFKELMLRYNTQARL